MSDAKRIWEGVCILEEVRLAEREDGRSEMVFVWKEGGEKRFSKFLRRGAEGPHTRPEKRGGHNVD